MMSTPPFQCRSVSERMKPILQPLYAKETVAATTTTTISLSRSLSPTLSFQGMVFPHYTFLTHSFSLPFALLVLSVSLLFFFIFILYYIELLYFDLHLQRLYLCLYVLMYICTYVCMHPCLYVTMSLCTYGYM